LRISALRRSSFSKSNDDASALSRATIFIADLKRDVMNTGTGKFFNVAKGFGFIQQDNGQPDVFAHISAVEQAGMTSLVEGQKLQYEIVKDNRSSKSAAANQQAA
jgi:CspA family cold shock protein